MWFKLRQNKKPMQFHIEVAYDDIWYLERNINLRQKAITQKVLQ